MANDLATIAPGRFGGLLPASTDGAEEFASHDPTKTWSDGGASDAIANAMADVVAGYGAEIAKLVGEQVRQALLEYATSAHMDLRPVDGTVVASIDMSNNEAPLGTNYRLIDHFKKAIAEAESAGNDEMLAAIGGFHEELGQSFRPVSVAVPRPGVPARPVRGGKPGAAGRPGAQRTARSLAPPRPA